MCPRPARDKSGKDLEQAAVLAAASEEESPGALLDAYRAFPLAGKALARRGARAAARLLEGKSEEAAEALARIAGR